MTNLDSIIKCRDITLPTKVPLVKAMVFPVVMYGCELDYRESWGLKNWCFWTVVLEKTLASPLDCKEIQPVYPIGDQSWVFIGRTDAEAETPIFWSPDTKSWLIWKDPDAVKDWGQEKKGTTEDEMVGWHHWLNGHGFGEAPRAGDRQGRLACRSSQGRKESDTTEQLNWTDASYPIPWLLCWSPERQSVRVWRGGWRLPTLQWSVIFQDQPYLPSHTESREKITKYHLLKKEGRKGGRTLILSIFITLFWKKNT